MLVGSIITKLLPNWLGNDWKREKSISFSKSTCSRRGKKTQGLKIFVILCPRDVYVQLIWIFIRKFTVSENSTCFLIENKREGHIIFKVYKRVEYSQHLTFTCIFPDKVGTSTLPPRIAWNKIECQWTNKTTSVMQADM